MYHPRGPITLQRPAILILKFTVKQNQNRCRKADAAASRVSVRYVLTLRPLTEPTFGSPPSAAISSQYVWPSPVTCTHIIPQILTGCLITTTWLILVAQQRRCTNYTLRSAVSKQALSHYNIGCNRSATGVSPNPSYKHILVTDTKITFTWTARKFPFSSQCQPLSLYLFYIINYYLFHKPNSRLVYS